MRCRKKPVAVEVMQWDGENTTAILDFATTARADADGIHIDTLEGRHRASVGDYIIKGVHGEFYPCKPDIFAETYEPDEPPQPLTLEELRGMDGKPVYIDIFEQNEYSHSRWDIRDASTDDDKFCGFRIEEHPMTWWNYGKTWLAYTTEPPKEETDGQ